MIKDEGLFRHRFNPVHIPFHADVLIVSKEDDFVLRGVDVGEAMI